MQKNTYDRIIGRLRQIKPESESSASLMDEVMRKLETGHHRKKLRIVFKANPKQLNVIIGIHVLSTAAAVFLIGLFVYQQCQFNHKTNPLETKIIEAPKSVVESQNLQTRQELVQSILEEMSNSTNDIQLDLNSGDPIAFDRNTLVYALKLSNEMKKKNRNNRQRLQEYLSDHAAFNIQILFDNENNK